MNPRLAEIRTEQYCVACSVLYGTSDVLTDWYGDKEEPFLFLCEWILICSVWCRLLFGTLEELRAIWAISYALDMSQIPLCPGREIHTIMECEIGGRAKIE